MKRYIYKTRNLVLYSLAFAAISKIISIRTFDEFEVYK